MVCDKCLVKLRVKLRVKLGVKLGVPTANTWGSFGHCESFLKSSYSEQPCADPQLSFIEPLAHTGCGGGRGESDKVPGWKGERGAM